MPLGTVREFLMHEGYGFIDPDDGSEAIFVHRKINGDGTDRSAYLAVGDRVEYEVEWNSRRGRYRASFCSGFKTGENSLWLGVRPTSGNLTTLDVLPEKRKVVTPRASSCSGFEAGEESVRLRVRLFSANLRTLDVQPETTFGDIACRLKMVPGLVVPPFCDLQFLRIGNGERAQDISLPHELTVRQARIEWDAEVQALITPSFQEAKQEIDSFWRGRDWTEIIEASGSRRLIAACRILEMEEAALGDLSVKFVDLLNEIRSLFIFHDGFSEHQLGAAREVFTAVCSLVGKRGNATLKNFLSMDTWDPVLLPKVQEAMNQIEERALGEREEAEGLRDCALQRVVPEDHGAAAAARAPDCKGPRRDGTSGSPGATASTEEDVIEATNADIQKAVLPSMAEPRSGDGVWIYRTTLKILSCLHSLFYSRAFLSHIFAP
jgi:cold shock CspA family protein